MINRNIQIKKKNDGVWENLFPLTLNENVFNNDGIGLTEQLNDLDNRLKIEFNDKMTSLETETENKLNQIENETENKLNQIENETDVKLKEQDKRLEYLFKDDRMTLFNMQIRDYSSDSNFAGMQGACFLGGSGDDINYALAFTPLDGNLNNNAAIITTNSNNLISESSQTSLKLYHANGFDLNHDTNTIYVSHTNTQTSSGSEANNSISEVSKDGKRVLRTISPKGLPSGRRVKYYSYDKKTGKKYIGDDYGVFEVDNELNVLKTINFSNEFLNHKNWGLGQTASVHNGFIFYLVMGSPSIAVFDLTGKLITLHQLPYITKEGVFSGLGPQALFFDNDDNLYVTTRVSYLSYNTNKVYIRVFKMNPFKGLSTDHYLGTTNFNTPNTVYVDPQPSSPIVDGSNTYPFYSVSEAINYALHNEAQKGFRVDIQLKAGHYPNTRIATKGNNLFISGESGVVFDALRIENSNIVLSNIKIDNNTRNNYSLQLLNSQVTIKGLVIDGKNKTYGITINDGSSIIGRADSGNLIENCEYGIYANSGLVVGTRYSLGLLDHSKPIDLATAAFATHLT